MSTTTLASERAWNLLKLAARQFTTGDFDQQPSLPHTVGVTVGVNVLVGVLVSVGGAGVFVREGVKVGDGVYVSVGGTVCDGVSVMVGRLVSDGVSVIVGVVRVGVTVRDAVGGLNRIVSTIRVYCRCGSLSRARIVIV